MNTRYERMSGFSLKLMAMIAGALMTPVFAAAPSPFNGAFVEGALGGSVGASELKTVSQSVNTNGVPNGNGITQSVSSTQSKSVVAGRVGVGYGYDLPFGIDYTRARPRFNLTGMLTYSTSQKVDTASKIKNSVSVLFQPGYYLPLKSNTVLIYGTVGYAKASFDKQEEKITVQDTGLWPNGQDSSYNSPPLSEGSFRAGGLVLGLGAKYAATDRLYAGFDYTHTVYKERNGTLWNWQDPEARTPGGDQASRLNVGTDWRVKFRTDTFLLTVGYRFF